jgi:para-nitrobenzyl esterase
MVWIHGGGFQTGSGSIPWYHGTTLARRDDVVVVSINYRLGVLGFTHLGPELGEAYAGSGNCGILDQIAALEWVRDNIEAFGGDASNVTVFGESAGGMSVGTLLGTPAAAGLFRRAIAESGACQALATDEQATHAASLVAQELGGYDALLTASVEDLLAAQNAVSAPLTGSFGSSIQPTGLLPFQPVVDGVVVPIQPLEAVAGGSAADVDLIAGTTAHEFTLFLMTMAPESLSADRLRSRVARMVGEERAVQVIDMYKRRSPDASPAELIAAVYTDTVFRLPCEDLLTAHAAASTGGSTRTYLFTYESPAFDGKLKATHAIEIPFVFGVVDRPGNELFLGPIEDATRALSDKVSRAWTAFARTGTPAAPDLPEWSTWEADGRATMELGLACRILADPSNDARAAWA